jgi:hypothetical protein
VIGDTRYSRPSFIPEFISPKVSRMRFSDPTMNEFYVEQEDPLRAFSILVKLGSGSLVSIPESNFVILKKLSCKLCNGELFKLI